MVRGNIIKRDLYIGPLLKQELEPKVTLIIDFIIVAIINVAHYSSS